MAVSLMEAFRSKVSKIKDSGVAVSAEFDIMYSSGFLGIDYLNGTQVHVESEDRNFTYNACGIVDGSTNTIIGRSGSGKSTLLNQIIGNIARPFIKMGAPTGIFIDDIEGSLPEFRKEFLLGLEPDEIEKYVDIRNKGITTENTFQRISAIHDAKIEHRKDYEYDTGYYDTHGNRVFKLYPTIYAIDSLAMLLPKDLAEDDELGGSMDASSVAKKNTMLLKKISQICKEANIILFSINHILEEIQMGFIPKAAQISGLKQGERLPGGRAAIYLANNMFRVDDSLTLKAKEGFHIDGSIVTLTIIKSRTNASKRSIPLVFNKTEGRFDEVLSLYMLLKDNAMIDDVMDDCGIRFNQGDFKDKFDKFPELQKAFAKKCYEILSSFLSDTRNYKADNNNSSDLLNDLINQYSNIPEDEPKDKKKKKIDLEEENER